MKLLYVIQDYGPDTFGGAESHCRMMATRMAARGHDVEVVTSCAKSYLDWANFYEPGVSEFEGVEVRRFEVEAPRDHRFFGALSLRVLTSPIPLPLFLQERWMKTQGPYMPEFEPWLWEHATDYDCVIFFTYLYWPTYAGLKLASGRVPTVLHALAHDELPFHLNILDTMFKLPTGFAYSLEEDAALTRHRAHPSAASGIIGIGVDQDVSGESERFRTRFDLGDDPYLLCIGRIDAAKGTDELFDQFAAYKERRPGPLKLVLLGEAVKDMPSHPDVIVTGFVDAQTRTDGLAGATVSMHPSYFESFSMALAEAWAARKPALVNGNSEVFLGQAMRSGGAIPYKGYAEFEAALDIILEEPDTAAGLGESGRAYVEHRYKWDDVMDRYEAFLKRVPVI